MLRYLKEHRSFILFLFVFSWVFTLKNRLGISGSWENFVFHPDAPYWLFLGSLLTFILIDLIKRKTEKKSTDNNPTIKKYIQYFGVGLICYMLYHNISGLLAALVFNTFERNFGTSHKVIYTNISQALNFIMFGGFSLAYLYFKDARNYKNQVNEYQISDARSKIQQLQNQLNPHFLFNNLNILDQLIEDDQEKASVFLGRFSEVYRFSLANSNKELIGLQDELSFTENYFRLMEEKYQGYYQLHIDDAIKSLKTLVPPFCLQILVENAILHNLGTVENQVIITMTYKNGITVQNNKIPLKRKKKSNGVALKNLNEQFMLLSNSPITIQDTDGSFTVNLPIIKMNSYD